MTATLKTTIIQEPDSATANITLDTSGNVAIGGSATAGGVALVTTSGTQTLTNKTINASQLVNASISAEKLNGSQSGSAPIYAARAWVNFNGTGTVAIRGSGNVTSITDLGTGNYRVNFTTAMGNTNYEASATCWGTASNSARIAGAYSFATGSVSIGSTGTGGSGNDADFASVVIFS